MWKTKLFRILEDNVSEYLCNFDTGNNSLNKTHKAQSKKEKTYKSDNIKTENSIIKRHHTESGKICHKLVENICINW